MITAIALDLGSTSIKAGLLDRQGYLSGIVAQPAPAINAVGGHYESDALSYAATADQVLNTCVSKTDGLPRLGLCSQRSSFLIWEQASGKPLTPLISWQDNRGAASCIALHAQEPLITGLTGLRLTPYYFAPKLRVLLQENPNWLAGLMRGELLVGTLDTFLIWRWTGGKQLITDVSMAARTLLMDIHQQQWSAVLCDLFNVPLHILPTIKPSTGMNIHLINGLTLQASLGDQSAALVASVGEKSEVALVNLGTGGFVIRYLADSSRSTGGYLRTLVYQDRAQYAHIAIEGTLNSIAAALAPYPVGECKLEEMAAMDNIFCLAEPSGLGAPYFRNDLGLQFSGPVDLLTHRQIACLLLEAIIFRVARIVEDFHGDAEIKQVYLSGGLSELRVLQQGIAQCITLNNPACEVFRLQQRDASLQGAAMLAAGTTQARQQDAERILFTDENKALREKYRRWKHWLDALLEA
ncbi:MAG TPA: FGGY family carbohydrate kinase [Gallionellaceae bacterium]|nr:FGGY family carbohydrate kinase [Gallionellaceae bacterium]